jgi:hypothetical protein
VDLLVRIRRVLLGDGQDLDGAGDDLGAGGGRRRAGGNGAVVRILLIFAKDGPFVRSDEIRREENNVGY